jgi:hypothetical protein
MSRLIFEIALNYRKQTKINYEYQFKINQILKNEIDIRKSKNDSIEKKKEIWIFFKKGNC